MARRLTSASVILDIMPTSESSERLLAGKGLPAFSRRAICLKVDCNVKREVRILRRNVERRQEVGGAHSGATGGTLR